MQNEEIIRKLNDLSKQSFSLNDFVNELQSIKNEYVKLKQDTHAKQIWIYQTIVRIHILYIEAFNHLKNKEYYTGWCELEKIEIKLYSLKRHFQYDKETFYLYQIEKNVRNLQVLFPYRLFISTEILNIEEKCTICNKITSIRKPCEHIVGEIYNGEMCGRLVTKSYLLGASIVTNPENKYAVLFPLNDNKKNPYAYHTIDYLFKYILNPYEKWDLRIYINRDGIKKEIPPQLTSGSLNTFNDIIKQTEPLHFEFVFYADK